MDRVEKLPSLARVVKHYAESYSPGCPVSEIRAEWFTACFAVPRVGCLPKASSRGSVFGQTGSGQTLVSYVVTPGQACLVVFQVARSPEQ